MQVVFTVLATVIVTLDLIGNVIVIHVIRTRTPMRTSSDLLIANLAAADLLMIPVTANLVKFYFRGGDWFGGIVGQITCRLSFSFQALSVLSSVYTIFAISIDRFCVVCFPLKIIVTKTRIKLCIVCIWLVAITFATPLFVVGTLLAVGKKRVCVPDWEKSVVSSRHYTLLFVVFSYFVPLLTITTIYLIIGVKLWNSVAPGHHSEEAIERMRAIRRKPTKMLISIVLVFALCWLPLQTGVVLRWLAPEFYDMYVPMKVQYIFPWFGIANSAINPFIYPIFSQKFRSEFKRIVCLPCFQARTQKSFDLTLKRKLNFGQVKCKLENSNVNVTRSTPSTPISSTRNAVETSL